MPDRPVPRTKLSAAQRRAVLESDRKTGELKGSPAAVAALVAGRLAAAHGRTGAHYLTERGRAVRVRLEASSRPADPPEAGSGAFVAAVGDEREPADPGARAAAVESAWAGLLEIRRVVNAGRPAALETPTSWERARMTTAVALTLEAAGLLPAAVGAAGRRVRAGYRIVPAEEPDSVRVEWRGVAGAGYDAAAERRLEACARTLAGSGWGAERYLGPRRVPFLLVGVRPAG